MSRNCLAGDVADTALNENDGRPVFEDLLQTLVEVARPPYFRLKKRLEKLNELLDPNIIGNYKYIEHGIPLKRVYIHMISEGLSISLLNFFDYFRLIFMQCSIIPYTTGEVW